MYNLIKKTIKFKDFNLATKRTLKKFDSYIEGDGELRKDIFSEKPASQQVIFELFSQLDETYYLFFLYFFSLPSTSFWNILLSQISAIASGSARNRNFCEDYDLLRPVTEIKTTFTTLKDKVPDLLGASHALWYEMSDPDYTLKPNTYNLWVAVYNLNPNRMVWEWWFESKARAIKNIWKDLGKPNFEDALNKWGASIGLSNPDCTFIVASKFIDTYDRATTIKHKIATPYLRLVYTITKSIAAYNQPGQFLDTFNIACTGLMRSIAKYAPSLSMAFSNFADREIRYEIYYQLSNYNLVSLPHKTWQRYREFEDLKKKYYKDTGVDASLDDLIKTFNLPRDDVYDIYRQVSMQNPHSLDQKVFSDEKADNKATLKEKIEDPKFIEQREASEKQQFLHLAMQRMSLKDRKIFMISNSLVDIVQDIAPDSEELKNFFWGSPKKKLRLEKNTEKNHY